MFADVIPIIIPEKIKLPEGFLKLSGSIQTFDATTPNQPKLFIMVDSVESVEKQHFNDVELEGYVAKTPFSKVTESGKVITSFILANNQGGISDNYIPVICWGAGDTRSLVAGSLVRVNGSLQSRKYHKLIDGADTVKEVYEVNVSEIKCI